MELSGINSNNSGVQNSTGGEKSTSEKTDAQKACEQISEYFAKYDTNKDGKISRKERKAAGLTKKQAREINRILNLKGLIIEDADWDDPKNVDKINGQKKNDTVTLEESYKYDEKKGNKLPVFNDDGKGNTTENKYYANGNLAAQSQTFPDGSKKEVKFDQDGNLISYVLKNADGETLEQPNKGMTAEKKEIRNEKFKGLENYNLALSGAHPDVGMMTVNGENVLISYWDDKYTLLRSSASGIGKIHTLDELKFSSMDEVKAALADKSYYWGSYNQGEVNIGDFVIP